MPPLLYTEVTMKIAIVHDWLTNMAGAEKVLLEMIELYPEADVYTSVYDPHAMPAFEHVEVRTTWLQRMPLAFKHQLWAPLRPLAFRMLDLSEYDVVITSDSAEAKNVRTRRDAVHISYNNTPIRSAQPACKAGPPACGSATSQDRLQGSPRSGLLYW